MSRAGEKGFDPGIGQEMYGRLPEPTHAYPGSPLKVEEMARRYQRLEHLYHPDDQANTEDHAWEIQVPRNGCVARNGKVEDLVRLLVRDEQGHYAPVPDQPERMARVSRKRTQKERDWQVANREAEAWRKRLERASNRPRPEYEAVLARYHEWMDSRSGTPPPRRIISQHSPMRTHTTMAQLLEAARSRFDQMMAPLQQQLTEIQMQMRAMEMAREVVQSLLTTDGPANGNGHPAATLPAPKARNKPGPRKGSRRPQKAAKAQGATRPASTPETPPAASQRLQVGKETLAGQAIALLIEHGPMKASVLAGLVGEEVNAGSLTNVLYSRKELFARDEQGHFSLATQDFDLV